MFRFFIALCAGLIGATSAQNISLAGEDAEYRFYGPGNSYLYAFFPLDNVTNLSPLYSSPEHRRIPQQKNGSSLASAQSSLGEIRTVHDVVFGPHVVGPFSGNGQVGFSQLSHPPHHHILRAEKAQLPHLFTLAFYVYRGKNNHSHDSIFAFPLTKPNLAIEFYSWNNSFMFVERDRFGKISSNRPIARGNATQPHWIFQAVTFDRANSAVTFYDEAGKVQGKVEISRDVATGLDSQLGFKFGRVDAANKAYCLQIYHGLLTPEDIRKLPCVCKTRGRCDNGKEVRKQPYQGPSEASLIGYWPLVHRLVEFDELNKGSAPSEVRKHRLVTGVHGGPFSQVRSNKTLYLPGPSEPYLAKFDRIPFQAPNKTDFTITFFLYDNRTEKSNETLPAAGSVLLQWSDELAFRLKPGNRLVLISKSFEIGTFRLPQVSSSAFKTWYFGALAYELRTGRFRQYDEKGKTIAASPSSIKFAGKLDANLKIGPSHGSPIAMTCLSLHGNLLSRKQVAAMRCTCGNTVAMKPEKCGGEKLQKKKGPSFGGLDFDLLVALGAAFVGFSILTVMMVIYCAKHKKQADYQQLK